MKIIKEKVVVEDIELGMGEAIQNRGIGNKLNADKLPYSETLTTKGAIDLKESISDNDTKLGKKMDKTGGTFTGPIHGEYPTGVSELATVQFVLNNAGGGSSPITWQGVWTPTAGTEYPTSPDTGFGYFVELTADYTFVGGDLIGQTVKDKEQMIFTAEGWIIIDLSFGEDTFYKLDGTNQLTANMQMGGYRIIDLQDGVNPSDGVTVRQLQNFTAVVNLDDLEDVNDTAKVDGDTLVWNATAGLWLAGAGIPKTDAPTFNETTVAMIQNESYDVLITNYSSTATYTPVSSDDLVATASITADVMTIISADLTADNQAIISVTALEPDFGDSVATTVTANITYVPFVESTVINNDFQGNAYYVDGFDFV